MKEKIITDDANGIQQMVSRDEMAPSAVKLRDIYSVKPEAPFLHREFGYYCMDNWYKQGLDENAEIEDVFGYDKPGHIDIFGLGWCEADFYPYFEERHIEDRGKYEVIQDAGELFALP